MKKKDKRFTITEKQRETIVSLYLADVKVTEISARTNVSTYSIYKILNSRKIGKRSVDNTVMKAVISFDRETAEIIDRENPNGLSRWICDLIKKNYRQ